MRPIDFVARRGKRFQRRLVADGRIRLDLVMIYESAGIHTCPARKDLIAK
jgi:hypothetical protein